MKKWRGSLLVVGLVVAASCDPIHDSRDQRESGDPHVETRVSQPEDFLYREIELEGTVERVFGKCAFELTNESTREFHEPLLVLCAGEAAPGKRAFVPPEVRRGDRLRLVGDVRKMTREKYESKTAAAVPEGVFGPGESRFTLEAETFEVLSEKSSKS